YHHVYTMTCSADRDEPPSYVVAARQKPPTDDGSVVRELPEYTSTVNAEGVMLYQTESVNPLHGMTCGEWREVYVVLRGTLLILYRTKDGRPIKRIKAYTLQHAEIGLAPDKQHSVLKPLSRMASLIPVAARRKAWQAEPHLFQVARQHIVRLRVETNQILLAHSSEQFIHDFIQALSSGIDIALPIDDRSAPRHFTLPRRRRRRQPDAQNLNDPQLLAEQEQILRNMYPAFARPDGETGEAPRLEREVDELDLDTMREEVEEAPQEAALVLEEDMIHSTPVSNFDPTTGKWQPPHPRTPAQQQRYIRRCMPILTCDARRASDVLISRGQRCIINWQERTLDRWWMSPPGYWGHDF
ncbi:hypothetical protein K470DRAFT_207467, partial [Piedraia hortae CBS 480.64]